MAEKDKKFYWLKLKGEFMNGEIVDFLMSQKGGANYVVLYQMLVLKTMNTQGRLCSEIGEILIPFDPDKIQRECKWFDIDTIRVAIELYSKLGLVYKNQDGILQITNFEDMVGSETYWAKQKRLEREQKGGQSLDNVQQHLISSISSLKSSDIKSSSNDGGVGETMGQQPDNVPLKAIKHKYGEYSHILLTDEELSKLQNQYGEEQTQKAITYLDEYIEMKGAKYKSHYMAMRKWVFDAVEEKERKNKTAEQKTQKGMSMWEKLDKVFDDE